MNAISSGVNKGAVKVAPKVGGVRRPRPSKSVATKANPAEVPVPAAKSDSTKSSEGNVQEDRSRQISAPPVPSDAEAQVPQIDKPQDSESSEQAESVVLQTQSATGSSTDHETLPAGDPAPPTPLPPAPTRVRPPSVTRQLQSDPKRESARPSERNPELESKDGKELSKPSMPHPPIGTQASGQPMRAPVVKATQAHSQRAQTTPPPSDNRNLPNRDPSCEKIATSDNELEAIQSSVGPETERSSQRQRRTNRRKREPTPEDAEHETIDLTSTKMVELCKDLRKGRKSSKHAEFVRIALERRNRKALDIPANSAATNDHGEDAVQADTESSDTFKNDQMQGEIAGDAEEDAESEDEEDAPRHTTGAPQVRIVNGQIVLDVASLQVDRAVRDAAADGETIEYVEENPLEKIVNSRSYSKHKTTPRWDALDTDLFYSGLSQWGTDFDMISRMFPSRTRRQIKNKYTIEEKKHPQLVTQAIIRRQPVDMAEYSRICEITYRPIEELEGELEDLKAKFEAEREEAFKEIEQRKLEALEDAANQPMPEESKRKAKRRRADDGLELVGSIEEVEAAEREAALLRAQSSDDEDDG